MPQTYPGARQPRRLSRTAARLVILIVLALFPVGLYVLAPWNYYFGGHFHLIPMWAAVGTIHTRDSGGDYSLYISLSPHLQQYQQADIRGTAWLCPPKGPRIQLYWSGDFLNHPTKDLTGQSIHFYASSNSVKSQFNGDHRPSLDFTGTFGNRQLQLDDRGTIAANFNPDGSLVDPRQHRRSPSTETVHFTLYEASLLSTAPPCPAR